MEHVDNNNEIREEDQKKRGREKRRKKKAKGREIQPCTQYMLLVFFVLSVCAFTHTTFRKHTLKKIFLLPSRYSNRHARTHACIASFCTQSPSLSLTVSHSLIQTDAHTHTHTHFPVYCTLLLPPNTFSSSSALLRLRALGY